MNPPSFESSTNKRQKARAAGLDPNYWYPVLFDSALRRGEVKQVTFWKNNVALYRDDYGALHAIEDRCAHRHVPMSIGEVRGDKIVCQYHGWAYDHEGRLAEVPHDMFGLQMPKCKLRTYPVKVRYSLIWIFFGDAERADEVPMPLIPDLEGPEPWACVPVEFTINAHHSMIIDNVSDFTHAYLHRKYKPFSDAKLTHLESTDDAVYVEYDTQVGGGKVTGMFIDRSSVNTNHMKLGYQYPYQFSNTDNAIKHWLFNVPIDERTTKSFYLFHFKAFRVPFTPFRMPKQLMKPVIRAANKLHIGPLLGQDKVACEAEQEGWQRHWAEPIAEISPAVAAFQNLTVRKWEEYLAREEAKKLNAKSLVRDKRDGADGPA